MSIRKISSSTPSPPKTNKTMKCLRPEDRWREWYIRSNETKALLVPISPPQIPYELMWDWTQSSEKPATNLLSYDTATCSALVPPLPNNREKYLTTDIWVKTLLWCHLQTNTCIRVHSLSVLPLIRPNWGTKRPVTNYSNPGSLRSLFFVWRWVWPAQNKFVYHVAYLLPRYQQSSHVLKHSHIRVVMVMRLRARHLRLVQ